jgi:hypothetical protein
MDRATRIVPSQAARGVNPNCIARSGHLLTCTLEYRTPHSTACTSYATVCMKILNVSLNAKLSRGLVIVARREIREVVNVELVQLNVELGENEWDKAFQQRASQKRGKIVGFIEKYI